MTWRTWIWRGPFFAMFVVLVIPMAALLIPINFMEGSGDDRIIGNTVMIFAFILIAFMHTWVTVRTGKVRLGFFPLYFRTLDISEIRYVIPVKFSPMRDFAGWGIKGLAKSRNGILLGGNPARGIMIETHDRRRYVLSFVDSAPVLRALEAQGCTVSEVPLIDDSAAGAPSEEGISAGRNP